MTVTLRARGDTRALAGAAVLGSMVGLAIGGAYLAGGMARAAVVHAQISRLAAVSDGFSETALAASSPEDPGVLAIARRHDPYAGRDLGSSERRLAAFSSQLQARLEGQADRGALRRVSLTSAPSTVVAAQPFHMRGALDASRDLECLTQAVYYEARGESRGGQAAVAQVVLNRTRHPAFPKSVCGVVFQRAAGACQFSFACDGSVYRRVESGAWRRAEAVAAKALDGFVMADVGNATHFHVARANPGWGGGLLRVSQIGSHVFYRFGGRAGSARSFTEIPTPSEPTTVAAAPQAVYASLSLAPLASTVASTVANSVASTVAAGAELVAAATTKGHGEASAAKPAAPAAAAPAATAAPAVQPAALVKPDETAAPKTVAAAS